MKKEVFILLLLMFALPVSAENFAGYKYPGDKFTLNEDNFSVQVSKEWDTLYLKFNGETFIIDDGGCEYTQYNFYTICFRSAVVDFSADPEIGRLDDRTGEVVPGLNITITYRKPDITLDRTFSNTAPFLQGKIEAIVTIENKGQNPAQIIYTEQIPNGFEVTPGSSVGYSNGKITYVTSMGQGAKKIFTYELNPVIHIDEMISGNLTYVYEEIEGTIKNTATAIKTKDSVELVTVHTANLNVAEKTDLKLTINNVDPQVGSQTKLKVTVPKELKVLSKDVEFEEEEGFQTYSFSSFIPRLKSETIDLTFETSTTGEFEIPLTLEFTAHGIEKRVTKNLSITVGSDKVEPSLTILEQMIGSNQKFKLTAKISNKDTDTPYYNINMNVDSAVLDENFAIAKILQNQEILIFERDVVAPTVDVKTDYDIVFTGKYETQNLEYFNFSLTKTISVYPPTDTVVIYHEFDKYTTDDDKAKVIVYVENKRDVMLKGISVSDNVPSSLTVIDGVTMNYPMNIEPKRKAQAYAYTIQAVPGEYVDATEIVTSVVFNQTDREFTLTQPLSIDLAAKSIKKEEAKVEVTEGDDFEKEEAAEEQQETSQLTKRVKKKSLWQKFLDWLLGFI
ncbi:hypothetical protein GOV08_04395 [Candidatus Woesearchaeota archaeon]|nr:hypothetical protein [Candidatus Woesearchaeota archaeon]